MCANRLLKEIKTKNSPPSNSVIEYFYPREHAILAEYFDLRNILPKCAEGIDPNEFIPDEDGYTEAENGIICRPSCGRNDARALSNAVARIALAPIRSDLPVWASCQEGKVFHTRQEENKNELPSRGYRSDPVLVLSINWADTGPGYNWPVKYYISWIPYYDRYVVTASYDSPVVEGYLDLAIGHLKEGASVESELKDVIVKHWDRDAMYLQGWESCLDRGIVKDPLAWRAEVNWGYDDEGNDLSLVHGEEDCDE